MMRQAKERHILKYTENLMGHTVRQDYKASDIGSSDSDIYEKHMAMLEKRED